jgi:hypothetical protein
MVGHGEKLGPRKEAAILALLSQRSHEDAAREARVPSRTLHRWRKEPAFDAALREAQRSVHSHAMGRLCHLANTAVTALGRAMVDPSTPPATRVQAADKILNHAAKAMEFQDIEPRVGELERWVELSNDTRGKQLARKESTR